MKTLRTLLVIAVGILGLTTISFGQGQVLTTQQLTANAQVFQPLTLAAGTALNFGSFAGLNSGVSTVIISATGGPRGGTARLIGSAAGNVGTFTITGEPASIVTIAFPATPITLTHTSGSEIMTIDANTWTTNVADLKSATLNGGSLTVSIGATLSVGQQQAMGSYTGTYDVNVNYN